MLKTCAYCNSSIETDVVVCDKCSKFVGNVGTKNDICSNCGKRVYSGNSVSMVFEYKKEGSKAYKVTKITGCPNCMSQNKTQDIPVIQSTDDTNYRRIIRVAENNPASKGMDVGVVIKKLDNSGKEAAIAIIKEMESCGINVVTDIATAAEIGASHIVVNNINEMLHRCKHIVTLGGDGTVLHTATYAAMHDIPIMGINLGTLGYMTTSEIDDMKDNIKKYADGKYSISERNLILGANEKEEYVALNDIVILKEGRRNLAYLDVYINGKLMDTYYCDGIIVSTATGTTAYNLSAGGPIARPELEIMVVTPICSHNVFHKPIILSLSDELRIVNKGKNNANVVASFDGEDKLIMKKDDNITIQGSKHKVKLIYTKDSNFYDVLKDKMQINK